MGGFCPGWGFVLGGYCPGDIVLEPFFFYHMSSKLHALFRTKVGKVFFLLIIAILLLSISQRCLVNHILGIHQNVIHWAIIGVMSIMHNVPEDFF